MTLRGPTASEADGQLSFRSYFLTFAAKRKGSGSVSLLLLPRPERRQRRLLPEPSGEAAHVLGHPAVLHRPQLGRLRRLLQVGRARTPPLQVGAASAGASVGLDAGVRRALKGESREVGGGGGGSALYY